jgi:hypothetical protein
VPSRRVFKLIKAPYSVHHVRVKIEDGAAAQRTPTHRVYTLIQGTLLYFALLVRKMEKGRG